MPSPEQFAQRMRVLATIVTDNVDKTVRRVALAVHQTVVLATPVDTGRARTNWQVALGSSITEEAGEPYDVTGQVAISRGNGIIGNRKVGESVYISNNVPYIGALNRGFSSQAPASFVEQAVAVGVQAVREARVTRRG